MKKLIFFLAFLLFVPAVIFAQDVLPPNDWGDIIMNPEKWFVSFGVFTLLIAFLTTFINGLFNVEKKWARWF